MDDFDGVEPDGDGRRKLALSYIVTESGTVDGVANDENATRRLTVTATDDGSGNIAASVSGADGNAFEFVNTFSAQTEIPAIPASKIVENAPEESDGKYLLALSPADDATGEAVKSGTVTMPDGKSYQAIEIGNGDEAAFEPMTVKRAGTYMFSVREVDPSDTEDKLSGAIDKVAGVKYDGTVYTFRARYIRSAIPSRRTGRRRWTSRLTGRTPRRRHSRTSTMRREPSRYRRERYSTE